MLAAHGVGQEFITAEHAQMTEVRYAKTTNRRVVGVMNQFTYLAELTHASIETDDLLVLSLKLAETPCGSLY